MDDTTFLFVSGTKPLSRHFDATGDAVDQHSRLVSGTKPLSRHFDGFHGLGLRLGVRGLRHQAPEQAFRPLGRYSLYWSQQRLRHQAPEQAFRLPRWLGPPGGRIVSGTKPLSRHFDTANAVDIANGATEVSGTKPLSRHFDSRCCCIRTTRRSGLRHQAPEQAFRPNHGVSLPPPVELVSGTKPLSRHFDLTRSSRRNNSCWVSGTKPLSRHFDARSRAARRPAGRSQAPSP